MDINNVKDIDNAKDNLENINKDKRILQDINKILYQEGFIIGLYPCPKKSVVETV